MNSRGKLLTDFEYFKAEFERRLTAFDKEIAARIVRKIDAEWTDLLWNYRDENHLIDSGFLRYFNFLCDVLLYRAGGTPQGKNRDAFDMLDEIFTGDVRANLKFLEDNFDYWLKVGDVDAFFSDKATSGDRIKKAANRPAAGKIIVYYDGVNFFERCLRLYGESADGRTRKFSLGEAVLLYAFLKYPVNGENISDADFRWRLRIVNNLVSNSVIQ